MKINIEGREIEAREGSSVLEAALEAGIYIPHLCKHPDLEAIGGCRLCSVEVEGTEQAVPSCMTQATEGMNIKINTDKANETRKMAMELILATHPADCTGCPKYGKCELQSLYQFMGVGPERWKKKSRIVNTDESNPMITHLFTRCIRCGRCVQACREMRGVKVLDFQKTKDGIRIGTDGGVSLEEAGCQFCGACIEVCPTGSIMDAVGMIKDGQTLLEAIVPCRSACPAGIDIPRYVRYIKNGDFQKATAVVREKAPFPETLGNICNHICESACKRNEFANPLSVCKLKRAAASRDNGSWKARVRKEEATGKKVAVIGGGPSGLTAAYYLAKKGHQVTVFEANEKAGGQCRYGIPSYRLADEVLDKEIADIEAEGVMMKTGTKIDSPKRLLEDGYDAVITAIGTHEGRRLPIAGNDLEGVVVNTDFLKQARMNPSTRLEGRVAVLGGGNVAFDCARSAVRLGAKEVHLFCLESREQMTADQAEIEDGMEEGVKVHVSRSFLEIEGKDRVNAIRVQAIEKFYFDEQGSPVLELVEDSQESIPVEHVIFAVGQRPEGTQKMELPLHHGSYLQVNEKYETGEKGIFAVGDVVTGTASVIKAIAGGREVASYVDQFLGGDGDISEQLLDVEKADPYIGRNEGQVREERYYPELLSAVERSCSFACVEKVLTEEEAKKEASRCLQCDLRLQISKPKLWNEYKS